MLVADGQLAGTPSVLFDAVVVILSDKGAAELSRERARSISCAMPLVISRQSPSIRAARPFLECANIGHEDELGVVAASDSDAFIAAAKTRQWER
jgi:catalase